MATNGGALPATVVVDLDQVHGGMLEEVGGKAANLGEMLRGRFPVPAGFCVTTGAYRLAAGDVGLGEVAQAIAKASGAEREELAARARTLLAGATIPESAAVEIRSAYSALSGTSAASRNGTTGAVDGVDAPGWDAPVAVRSSATAEDLPFASFAGQQDSFLQVVGIDAVLDAVRRCWASLWTDRAVAYRATNGIDGASAALAVVVQLMVPADVAGVLFTANPVTGTRGQLVIDASPGLGEAVVSGMVDPDHIVADGGSGRILSSTVGRRQWEVRPRPGGGTERLSGASDPASLCLGTSHIQGLAALARRLEAHFGAPQDAEWALDADGRLWLTQTRAITTLYPLPARRDDAPADQVRAYFCFSLAQGLTRPLTPMGLAGMKLLGASIAAHAGFSVPEPLDGPSPFMVAGGRVYIDATTVVRSEVGRVLAPKVLGVMEARSAVVLRRLFEDERFSITTRSALPLLRRVGRIAAAYRVPAGLARVVLRPQAALENALAFEGKLRARLATGRPSPDDGPGLLARARQVFEQDVFPVLPSILPAPAGGFAMAGLAQRLLRGIAEPGELQAVMRGLPNNATTEMDLQLWSLAADVRDGPDADAVKNLLAGTPAADLARAYLEGGLPASLQSGLSAFLGQYGHRAVGEIDVGLPRWSEDPGHILGVLAGYLALGPGDAPEAKFAESARAGEAMAAELVARARRKGPLPAAVAKGALRRARLLGGLREQPKYLLIVAFDAARRDLLRAGVLLAERGILAAAEDIFFLGFAEAGAGFGPPADGGAALRELVQERQAEYARELRRRHIPRVLLSDGTEPEAVPGTGSDAAQTEPGQLRGTPASAGTVSGTARVILDPVGARLEPGEILVAPSTDPGWTPLFLTAGGLVMEMGGANSHGAVVAREYGIPAVVGVPDATSLIDTGRHMDVDGGAGTVRLAD